MKDTTNAEAKKKMGVGGKILLGAVGFFVLIALLGDEDEPSTERSYAAASSTTAEIETEPQSTLTGPQRNALRSAKSYIAMKGFSRAGLIEQLSSDHGEGYEVADATFAVDSLNIDWSEQAAREAASYLKMKGFSCNGLIEQLSSDHGAGYTAEQARYGASQAGAC